MIIFQLSALKRCYISIQPETFRKTGSKTEKGLFSGLMRFQSQGAEYVSLYSVSFYPIRRENYLIIRYVLFREMYVI